MSSSSAETVANIEDLLKQILISVPALSLIRFQCVSKHWLSLISDPDFRCRHTLQNPNPKISAFFSSKLNYLFQSMSIPLETPSGNPFKILNNSELTILQSCNGLFLLCHIPLTHHHPVYVVNPTTNQFRTLSSPSVSKEESDGYFVRYALAFDPSKSPHYKVVCVSNNPYYHKTGQHKIDIYSSETGEWKHLKTPFFPSPSDEGRHHHFVQRAMHFDFRSREDAVYCDGAVHWIRYISWIRGLPFRLLFADGRVQFEREETDVLHYFEISKERLLVVPATPPVSSVVRNLNPRMPPRMTQRYFGECGGCLYLIETYKHCMTQFEVMQMERDYSGWFVKYHVDLNQLAAALHGPYWNVFPILCLSLEKEKGIGVEDSSIGLLVHLPGKVISYNLTFKTTVELANKQLFLPFSDNHILQGDVSLPFMETLACS